jgi:hypothetical protein
MNQRRRLGKRAIQQEIMANCEFVTISLGPGWRQAQKRLSRQLTKLYKNATIHEINDENYTTYLPGIEQRIFDAFGTVNTRGHGYWMWKPLMLEQIVKNSFENKIVLYLDSGCEINESYLAQLKLLQLVSQAQTEGFVLFELPGKIAQYCNRRLLNHEDFTAIGREKHMVSATSFMLTKATNCSAWLESWAGFARDEPLLFSDHQNAIEGIDFIDHRHDQSVLSCIVHSAGITPSSNLVDLPFFASKRSHAPIYSLRNRHLFSVSPSSLVGIIRFLVREFHQRVQWIRIK